MIKLCRVDHQIIIKQLFCEDHSNLLHYQNTKRIHDPVRFLVIFYEPYHTWRSSNFSTNSPKKLQYLKAGVDRLTFITFHTMKVHELTSTRVKDCLRSVCRRSVAMAGVGCRHNTSPKLLDTLYSPCIDLHQNAVEQRIWMWRYFSKKIRNVRTTVRGLT